MIYEEKLCKTCKGKKVKREKVNLKVEIFKGTPDDHKYIIAGEGNCDPNADPGDVHVIVKVQTKSKLFERKGADLYMIKEISLLQALTGLDYTIMHLDGRTTQIKTSPEKIMQAASGSKSQKMTCEGVGMPLFTGKENPKKED